MSQLWLSGKWQNYLPKDSHTPKKKRCSFEECHLNSITRRPRWLDMLVTSLIRFQQVTRSTLKARQEGDKNIKMKFRLCTA
jgi:hypothetical protein